MLETPFCEQGHWYLCRPGRMQGQVDCVTIVRGRQEILEPAWSQHCADIVIITTHRELSQQAWDDLCSDGDDLLWYRHLPVFHESRWFVRDEPERSRRVARLVFANWTARCEEPSSLWSSSTAPAPISPGGTPLLLLNSASGLGAPTPLEGLTPADLSDWYDSTLLFRRLFNNELRYKLASYQSYVIRRRADHAGLIVRLAEQLYAREHGGHLPTSPQELVGPYIKALPETDLAYDGR